GAGAVVAEEPRPAADGRMEVQYRPHPECTLNWLVEGRPDGRAYPGDGNGLAGARLAARLDALDADDDEAEPAEDVAEAEEGPEPTTTEEPAMPAATDHPPAATAVHVAGDTFAGTISGPALAEILGLSSARVTQLI